MNSLKWGSHNTLIKYFESIDPSFLYFCNSSILSSLSVGMSFCIAEIFFKELNGAIAYILEAIIKSISS